MKVFGVPAAPPAPQPAPVIARAVPPAGSTALTLGPVQGQPHHDLFGAQIDIDDLDARQAEHAPPYS